MAVSKLQLTKHGRNLWRYWTSQEGMTHYIGKPHPWTALKEALMKESAKNGNPLSEREAEGLATNIMMATPQGRAAFKQGHSGHPTIGQRVMAARAARKGKR